jgi:hypothetical protein
VTSSYRYSTTVLAVQLGMATTILAVLKLLSTAGLSCALCLALIHCHCV